MKEQDLLEETPQQLPLFKVLSKSSLGSTPNKGFKDGAVLPTKLSQRFLQQVKPCVPLKEIDQYYQDKETFIVIGRWGTIHRFSSSMDGCMTFSPNSPLRKFAIHLITNWLFSLFILATLLLNCVALLTTQTFEIQNSLREITGLEANKPNWIEKSMYIVNIICLTIYCVELVFKVVARGLTGPRFSALHDSWTWLDILVIWTGFFSRSVLILHGSSAQWIRIFKIIPLIPNVRQASSLSLRAIGRLGTMLLLLLITLWGFSLLGSQLYMGTLTQKCIKVIDPDSNAGESLSDAMWDSHNFNMTNWYLENGFPTCGNASGSRPCPEGYVCLQGYGKNPDEGLTNFDDVFWSLISVLRLANEDFQEEIFGQVLRANGPWHMLFFAGIVLLITYPMGCLFFAILGHLFTDWKGSSTEEEVNSDGLENGVGEDTDVKPLEKNGKADGDVDGEEHQAGLRQLAKSITSNDYVRFALIAVILADTVGLSSAYYGIGEDPVKYLLFLKVIPLIVFAAYMTELLLKLIALGPQSYLKNRWNLFDLLVLLTFPLEAQSYLSPYNGFVLAPIRMLKLVQYWPSLLLIFSVYSKTIKALWGWALYALIVFAFIIFIGPFELGQKEIENGRFENIDDFQRWSFVDFWHSFRMVLRMQIAEVIETFWDVYPFAPVSTVVYYAVATFSGALLISVVLVGLVYTTVKELQGRKDEGGLSSLLRKCWSKKTHLKEEEEGEDKRDGQHLAYKIGVCFIIVVASVAMIFEDIEEETLQTGLFAIEILFTVAFGIIILYELVTIGVKESVMNGGWIFDVIITLENVINLAYFTWPYQPGHINVSVSGPFLLGMFYLRSFRPLMLVSRVGWLKAPFKGYRKEIRAVWEVILAILFIWLVFVSFGVQSMAGKYHKCLDMDENEVVPTLSKIGCLANNHSWVNSDSNFDNAQEGFLNMVFLVSRMGWVQIINDGLDAGSSEGMPRETAGNKLWIFYFMAVMLFAGLGPMAILFSHVLKQFKEDQGYGLILTKSQATAYSKAKKAKCVQKALKLEQDYYIPPPESSCLGAIYKFVSNPKFEVGVVMLIIIDMVNLSFDHYQLEDPKLEGCIEVIWSVILALYTVEMVLKIVAWRKDYFKCGWNYLDVIVVLSGLLGVFLECCVGLVGVRILRLARVIRFLGSPACSCKTARVFRSSLGNVKSALANLILLHMAVMWAYALLGHFLFADVEKSRGLNDVLNFDTFQSSLWVLILLLGFPCLDGLYFGLKVVSRTGAVLYIGSYAALTFLFLLNMYAVLISEFLSEMDEHKNGEGQRSKDISLENVSTERATSNGELTELQHENGEVKEKC